MAWYKPWSWGDESDSAKQQRGELQNQANQADSFRDYTSTSAGALGTELGADRERMRRRALGQDSLSAEQLRQGLQQQQSAQMSMAAGASPQNSAMAARTAAMMTGRNQAQMSGQAALAGIQERMSAEKQLSDMLLQQRQQDVQGTLGAGQNAINALSGQKPEGSWLDKWGGAIAAGAGYASGGGKK